MTAKTPVLLFQWLPDGAVPRLAAQFPECEIIDGVPVRVAHGARSFHPGWLAEIARIGKGGNDRYFDGLHLRLCVSSGGIAAGWTLASAKVQAQLGGATPRKVIVVPDRLVNIVA